MEAMDLRLDDDGDLYINETTGDLEIAPSDKQHIKDIINANVGWYKQFPLVGVGIHNYLNSAGKEQQMEREIKVQLTADGYTVGRPKIDVSPDGTLIIEPNAQRH